MYYPLRYSGEWKKGVTAISRQFFLDENLRLE